MKKNIFLKDIKLLRKQMELLAEQSKGAVEPNELKNISTAMCEIHNALVNSIALAIRSVSGLVVIAYLAINIVVLFQKFFRSKTR